MFLLIIFLVTFVVPNFADSVRKHVGATAGDDAVADRGRDDGARIHSAVCGGIVIAALLLFRLWSRGESARLKIDAGEAADSRFSARSG